MFCFLHPDYSAIYPSDFMSFFLEAFLPEPGQIPLLHAPTVPGIHATARCNAVRQQTFPCVISVSPAGL